MGGKHEKEIGNIQREKLYEEIWELSLSKVAKKYNVQYTKLKEACKNAHIPLPSNSYWGNPSMGNPVPKEPLPESVNATVTVEFSVKTATPAPPIDQNFFHKYLNIKSKVQENDKSVVPETVGISPPKKSIYDGNLYEHNVLYD